VTEQEWLTGTDPLPLLEFLRGKASQRKLRLFAVACCRRLGDVLWDEAPVVAGERYAEGLLGRGELEEIRAAALAQAGTLYRPLAAEEVEAGRALIEAVTAPQADEGAALAARVARTRVAEAPCALVREIFGNPFRIVAISAPVLAWNGGTVRRLAEAVYDERTFDRLPVLADALEEAGYTDPNILDHLRGPGQLYRGCFLLDLVLGKK